MFKRSLFFLLLTISTLLANISTLEEITGVSSQDWIQSGDRWTFEELFEDKRDQILPVLESMGVFEDKLAQKNRYDCAMVLGSLHASVERRFTHLIDEWNRGVRLEKVIFLTGQRPLHIEKEKEFLHLESETAMMVWTWSHMDIPEDLRALSLEIIDAPALPGGGRPTTESTVYAYLETNPIPGSLLIFSCQPYVEYQKVILQLLLPSNFEIEAVGPAGGRNLPTSVLLDTQGKQYSFKHRKFSR